MKKLLCILMICACVLAGCGKKPAEDAGAAQGPWSTQEAASYPRERILLAEREVRENGKRLGALSPDKRIDALSARSRLTREALKNAVNRRAEAAGMNVRRLREKLEAINPLGVLERGYALIYAGDGKLVTRRAEAEKEKQLAVRFADGRIEVETTGRPVQ